MLWTMAMGLPVLGFTSFFLWNYLAFNITLNSWLWYFIKNILLFTRRDVADFVIFRMLIYFVCMIYMADIDNRAGRQW